MTQVINNIRNFFVGIVGFGVLDGVIPEVPDANIAALSPYGGTIGW